MMSAIGLWILAILFVEAVTEILVAGAVFDNVRKLLFEFSGFTAKLISCGYCLSVWVAFAVSWVVPTGIDNIVGSMVLSTFALHRLSNIFHEFAVRWLNRVPWTVQLNQIQHVIVPGMEDENDG